MAIREYLGSLRYDLPREVYVLQAGLLINAFGNGAANPFILIYLHNVRGIALPVAGLVSATGAGVALISALAAGSFADRRGSVTTMTAGLWCSALAFACYPLIRQPWQAFVLSGLAAAGTGVWLTMQSSVLALITPPAVRHAAFAQQRVVANVGLGLGGFVGGLIAGRSFTLLFLLNAVTFLAYTGFLVRLRLPQPVAPKAGNVPSSYREVLHDRAYLRVAVISFAVVVGAVSLLNGLFPVYAKDNAGVSETTIGIFFLLNSATIIIFQLPVARAAEGRRRSRALVLMGALFAICWLLVATAPGNAFAVGLLATGILAMSFGECLYDAVVGPLTADLAPPHLLGRYMAVNGFTWQLGFIIGPAMGAYLLAATGSGVWLAAAALCAAGGLTALTLDRKLPAHALRTPPPAPAAPVV